MRRLFYYTGFSLGVFTLLLSGWYFMMGILAQGFGDRNSDGFEIASLSAGYLILDLMFLWSLRKVVYQGSENIYERKILFFSASILLVSCFYYLREYIQYSSSTSTW